MCSGETGLCHVAGLYQRNSRPIVVALHQQSGSQPHSRPRGLWIRSTMVQAMSASYGQPKEALSARTTPASGVPLSVIFLAQPSRSEALLGGLAQELPYPRIRDVEGVSDSRPAQRLDQQVRSLAPGGHRWSCAGAFRRSVRARRRGGRLDSGSPRAGRTVCFSGRPTSWSWAEFRGSIHRNAVGREWDESDQAHLRGQGQGRTRCQGSDYGHGQLGVHP